MVEKFGDFELNKTRIKQQTCVISLKGAYSKKIYKGLF